MQIRVREKIALFDPKKEVINEIYLFDVNNEPSAIAYYNGFSDNRLFDACSGQAIENEEIKKSALAAIREHLYGKNLNH